MRQIWKQFNNLLNKKQKIRLIIIIVMMVIGGGLETLGVGMIVPIINALMNVDQIMGNNIVIKICDLLNIKTVNTFVIMMIISLIVIYLIKGIYLYLLYYVQYRFVYNNRYALQRRLMGAYLSRPYEFFLKASSGEIVNSLTNDVPMTFDMLMAFLSLLTEAIVVVILFAVIIAISPIMAISIAFVLGLVMLLILKFLKPSLSKAGTDFQTGMSLSNKWILQSVSGIKEVKVGKKENYFLNEYSIYGKCAVNAQRKSSLLGNIPRIVIETFAVITILLVMVFIFLSGDGMVNLIPQLSAFALAAVRILPGLNRMSTYRNQMEYYKPMLIKTVTLVGDSETWGKTIHAGVKIMEKQVNKISLNNACELQDITFTYPGGNDCVLEHASMKIPVGKSVGIIGPSGSGKSTAIDIMLGLLEPQSGQILSDGTNITEDYEGWLSHVGYIPQMIYMLDDTIRRNVAFGHAEEDISDEKVWKALEDAKLAEYIKTLPEGIDTSIGERGIRLSGGQRQRIGIARALYENPELLIFDEATSSLDNQTEAEIIDSINSLHGRKTMLIIAHRLATIEDCDILYKVENKKIERVK